MNYLVPLDGSKNAKAAFYTTLSLFKKGVDKLFLLSVVEDVKPFMNFTFGGDIDVVGPFLATQEAAKEEGTQLLREYAKISSSMGIEPTLILSVAPHVGEMICQAVEQKKINTLVMGRRGMNTVKRIFVGSNSSYCIENAKANVLVVKGDWGPAEEHVDKKLILELEEKERKDRIENIGVIENWETAERKLQKLNVAQEAAETATMANALREAFPVTHLPFINQ